MTKQQRREKRKEILAQNKAFAKRLNVLFAKKYRTSLRYEDSLIKEDGKAHVNVDLTKLKSPFSVFSYDKRMDPEIYDYIDRTVFYLRASVPVVINFDDGGKYSQEMKDKIRNCVTRYYCLNYEDKRLEHRKGIIFGLTLLLVGLTIFFSRFFIANIWDNSLFQEISLILSWMFIWTSVDFFFVSGHSRRVEVVNAGQLALAEVTFGKPR